MSRPLHVGLLAPAYAGLTSTGSGIGVHFRSLAVGLAAAGHRVTVVYPSTGDKAPPPSAAGLAFIPARVAEPPLARLAGRLHWPLHQWLCERARLRALARAAAGVAAEVWETSSTGAPSLLVRVPGPVAVRVSTTASQLRAENSGPRNWISRRHEAWEAAAIRRADRVLTHSPGHRAALATEFGLR